MNHDSVMMVSTEFAVSYSNAVKQDHDNAFISNDLQNSQIRKHRLSSSDISDAHNDHKRVELMSCDTGETSTRDCEPIINHINQGGTDDFEEPTTQQLGQQNPWAIQYPARLWDQGSISNAKLTGKLKVANVLGRLHKC